MHCCTVLTIVQPVCNCSSVGTGNTLQLRMVNCIIIEAISYKQKHETDIYNWLCYNE